MAAAYKRITRREQLESARPYTGPDRRRSGARPAPIGRPFAFGVLGLVLALVVAGLVPGHRALTSADVGVLASVAATGAATTSLVAGLITLSRFPVSHQRVTVDAGAILVLTGTGWVLPATVAPLLADGFRAPLSALVLGAAGALAVASFSIATGPEIDAGLERGRRLALLMAVVVVIAGVTGAVLRHVAELELAVATVDLVSGLVASLSAAALLLVGYRRQSRLVTFVGLHVLGLQLFHSLAVGAPAGDPWRFGASMVALVAAVIGLAGALLDYQAFAAQQQSRTFRAWVEAQTAVRRHADLVRMEQERFHDLRAGLLGIGAFLRGIGDRPHDPAVLAELERLRAITMDTSDEPLVFDLAAAVRDLAAARAPGRIVVEAPEHLPVIARRADLLEAIANLVDNARTHAPGANARIRVAGGGPTVELEVADNGPGVDPRDLPRLFDRGFTTRPEGSGLGLYIVDAVVRGHGGRVEVRPLDPGVAFTCRLDIGLSATPKAEEERV
jgi:signal transduction histidine kinase